MHPINLFNPGRMKIGRLVLIPIILILLIGIVPAAPAMAEAACFDLILTVDGGEGLEPLTDSADSPNCPEGQYAAGTVIQLTAQPDKFSAVLSWRGTDDDSAAGLTNQITVTGILDVGITYQPTGDPAPPLNDTKEHENPVIIPDKAPPPAADEAGVLGGGGDDSYEENDFLVTAYDFSSDELTWLSTISGNGYQYDEDWYRIAVTPGFEYVDIDLTFTHASGDIDLEFFDSQGKLLAISNSLTDNENIFHLVPATGYYYIKVYYDNAGNSYDLWWDDVAVIGLDFWETDDTFVQASEIIHDSGQVHMIGTVGDIDMVYFDLDGNTGIVLETSGPGGTNYDLLMGLFNAPNWTSSIETNYDGGYSYHARIDRTCKDDLLPAGTYYAVVNDEGNNNTIAKYNLSLLTYPCLGSFEGSAVIGSTGGAVAIGRPHMGSEIMAYNALNAGATTVYLPMLFNDIWGGWDSTFIVQNASPDHTTYDVVFRNASNGAVACILTNNFLPPGYSQTFDLTTLPACDLGPNPNLPTGWFGGAVIYSYEPITATAKPRIYGTDAVAYNGLTGGAQTVYLPMLFRDIWGYESAFYVQNIDNSTATDVFIDFYDNQGVFTCEVHDTLALGASETRGYWMRNIDNSNCATFGSGTGFLPGGWAGSAVVTAGNAAVDIVAIGRPHMGNEVAAYPAFTSGNFLNMLPMLFRGMWGYDSAIYVQNISFSASSVSIMFFDTAGNYLCNYDDPTDITAHATRGYWLPFIDCNDTNGPLPPGGWAGSAVVVTGQNAVTIGRPHLSGGEVVAYNGFIDSASTVYVPNLYAQDSGNESALYVMNTFLTSTSAVINLYKELTWYPYCTMVTDIGPWSSRSIWLGTMDSMDCVPYFIPAPYLP